MFLVDTYPDPIRIHNEARQLSRRSVQEIARLVGNTGKRAWLLVGDTSQTLPEMRFIDAYLEPEVIVVLQSSTRSGQTATLSRNGSTWKLVSVSGWLA